MSEMVPTGSQYTDKQRKAVVVQYAIDGLMSTVSRDMGIPETTLSQWKRTEWFDAMLAEVRSSKADEHIAQYHKLTTKALDKADQAIDNLDGKLTAGDIKALVVAGCASSDKARLLLNQPTTISGKSEGMTELAAQFRKLSADHKAIQDTVVSTIDKE